MRVAWKRDALACDMSSPSRTDPRNVDEHIADAIDVALRKDAIVESGAPKGDQKTDRQRDSQGDGRQHYPTRGNWTLRKVRGIDDAHPRAAVSRFRARRDISLEERDFDLIVPFPRLDHRARQSVPFRLQADQVLTRLGRCRRRRRGRVSNGIRLWSSGGKRSCPRGGRPWGGRSPPG